jgi:hypothetical protein
MKGSCRNFQSQSNSVQAGMGEIGNISDLNLKNYLSVFVASILILIIIVSVLKCYCSKVRKVEIKSIQFNTKW